MGATSNGEEGHHGRQEEEAEEEDFDGLMKTVAEAVRAAEIDVEASQAAREGDVAAVA